MPIIAAAVEPNGWVLALTLAGAPTVPATNFAAYALDPDGAPRLTLALSSPGFVKSGGQAVAGSSLRSLVGLRALRKPVDPLNPLTPVLDESDLGNGSFRVRIALSEEVYANDSGLSLTALAGWYTGEAAASGMAVTNNSTLAPPVPVMRWALPAYDTASGAFRVTLLVGTVHPQGFEPAAGVRFTATDGANVKTLWLTALDTDNSHGDSLRAYTGLIDPATATALNAGLLRVDAEVYPWLGAMRTTDPAGTRAMPSLRADGFSLNAEAPWVIGYDPAGSRYGQMWVYVDPVSGTTTASAAMVATTLAGAKAVAPAARPRNLTTAIAALGLVNRTLAAANGQASQTRSVDGAFVVLAPGVHADPGATAISSTIASPEIPVRVIGDPDDSNPRANCILETAGTTPNLRITRIAFRNLTIRSGAGVLGGATLQRIWFDNVEITGKAGSEAATTFPVGSTAASAGTFNVNMTRTKVWRAGYTIGGANRFIGVLRASEFSRRGSGLAMVRNRWIGKAEDGFTASNTQEGLGPVPQTATLAGLEDIVIACNDMRAMRWAGWTPVAAPAALAGVSPQAGRHRRHLILNNIFERISGTNGVSATSDTFFGYGEAAYVVMDTLIIEGNTVAGSGYNAFYSDPTPVTLADVDSQTNITLRIRHANNATDRNASKQDDFSDPNTMSIRAAAGAAEAAKAGYRPACIGAWSVHFGVGMEAHVDFARKGTITDFRREHVGLRGVQYTAATAPGWTADRSEAGSDLGGGDYRPTGSSPVLGRVRRANSDRDWAGNARLVNGASGAIEADTELTLAPAGARSLQTAATPGLGLALALGGAGAAHGLASQAAVLTLGLALTPDLAAHAHRVTAAGLAWGAPLLPEACFMASRAATPALDAGAAGEAGDWLAPDGAGLFWSGGNSMLFPDSTALAGGILNVPADIRMLILS